MFVGSPIDGMHLHSLFPRKQSFALENQYIISIYLNEFLFGCCASLLMFFIQEFEMPADQKIFCPKVICAVSQYPFYRYISESHLFWKCWMVASNYFLNTALFSSVFLIATTLPLFFSSFFFCFFTPEECVAFCGSCTHCPFPR